MRSIMQHQFSNVPPLNIPRSTFDRSHKKNTTFDADRLIPVLVDEVMPGDTFKCDMSFLCRMSTPSFPLMTNLFLDSFFFFVPYRIIWENWVKLMGEQDDPGDSIAYTVPQITLDTDFSAGHGSLADYFEIPLIDYNTSNYTCSALPMRAYFKIWDDWFRDENLQNNVFLNQFGTGNGPDADNYFLQVPLKRGKRHDFFTSALLDLQKGDPVSFSLGTQAPVYGIGLSTQTYPQSGSTTYETDGSASTSYANYALSGVTNYHMEEDPSNAGFPNIRADLTAATAITVNEIRQAFQVQKFLELSNRVGTRYTEIIQGIYGVPNAGGDGRLHRAEYLGGGSSLINVSPVVVTADSGNFEAGELTAVGVGSGKHGFIKSFNDHGVLIGLVNVRADIEYQSEGFDKMWHRSTRYDYYAPSFAHIGEQAILNRELYIDDSTITAGTDEDVFGYQMAWDDYRYKQSKMTGYFRSNCATTLDTFHLAEEFGATQTLNSTFIQSNAAEGLDRTLQTPTEPHFFFSAYFDYKCTRPMPVFSVPGFIDHF